MPHHDAPPAVARRWVCKSAMGALALMAGVANAQTVAPGVPIVPFNSNFWSYWTHYWCTWLPDHPVYEMIELTAYENPNDPSDLLVRVFLTEREGRKRQYFYLNNEEEVRRSRANAFFRDISYRRSGSADGPQNLEVSFVDREDVRVEWTIRFPRRARLRDHGDGLTPSIHSVGAVLLFALRTRTVDTHDDRVLFSGVDYASQRGRRDRTRGTRSWYNPDYYSAVLVYGRAGFTMADGTLSNTWGRRFSRDASGRYRSNVLGPENFVEFDADAAGNMRRYAHMSRGHSLEFHFDPALPAFGHARDGDRVRFSASFDHSRQLMVGEISISKPQPDVTVLDWRPDGPAWAVGRDFRSTVITKPEGYEVVSGEGDH